MGGCFAIPLTAYALAQFLFTPRLRTLSDRYGRRPIIFVSLLIEALSLALCALAGSLPFLLVARFIGGLGASNIGSAQAVTAFVTLIEGRARGMGLIGAAIGLGFVVGPALGGLLAPRGPSVPFWVAMFVALTNALLVLRFLTETRWMGTACLPSASHKPERGLALAGWRQMQRHPLVARLVVVNLLFTIAFTAMETVFALFTQHAFGWTTRQNGYLFTYIGLLVVFMQGGVEGQLERLWGERRLLLAGLVLLAVGLALLPWSTNLASFIVVVGIVSIGDGAVTPMLSTLLSCASAPEARGETPGLAQGVAGLARIIVPVAAGVAFAVVSPGVPFLLGSALVAVATLIAFSAPSSMHEGDLVQSAPAVQTASFEEIYLALDFIREQVVIGNMSTPVQFAKRVNVSVKTIRQWYRLGILPAKRTIINRCYYIDEDLTSALQMPRVPSARRTVATAASQVRPNNRI